MKLETSILLYSIGIIAVIVASILTAGIATLPLPAPLPLGMFVIVVIALFHMGVHIIRGKSPHASSNAGYGSITAGKDIHHFPFHLDILKDSKTEKKDYGDLTYMFLGGIDYWAFNPESTCEFPVWIFPSRFEKKIGRCYSVEAHLQKRDFKRLPPEIRKTLMKEFPDRVIPGKTEIYYGLTSHLDGSATPDNEKIEFKMQDKYEYAKELEDLVDQLFKKLRQKDEEKTKKLWIGQEIKPIGDEK